MKLVPIVAIRTSLGELAAADTAYLAAATAMKVFLIKAPFTPSENLVIGDLTPADFDGSTPLACGTGTQLVGLDPSTGLQLITLKEPAGGFRWETTGLTNLPQAIYGFGVTDNAGTLLLGTGSLPTALPLSLVGQEINLGSVQIAISPSPFVEIN